MLTLLLAAVAAAAPLARPERAPVPTVIAGAMVLDREGVAHGPSDVWIADGTVVAVLPAGSEGPFAAQRTIDATGDTLMPGLVDVHVHIASTTAVPGHLRVPSPRDNLEAFLFAGVTSVLDPGADTHDVARWQRKIESGAWAGPELTSAGRPFGAPEGHPRASVLDMFPSFLVKLASTGMSWEVDSAQDVDAALEAQGPTAFVKVVLDSLPPGAPPIGDEPLQRLRERTTEAGERLVAHVGRAEDVQRAIDLPVDALMHSPHTGEITPEQAAALAEKGIPVVPTLVVWQALAKVEEANPWIGETEREIAPKGAIRDLGLAAEGRAPVEGDLAPWAQALAAGRETREGNVRRLRDAGVEILVGSDAPGIGLVAGSGTHHELSLLVGSGLTPSEALAAATWKNARFIDPDAHDGAVEPGYEADLLLVRGEPTAEISATRDIVCVWTDGRLVERHPRWLPIPKGPPPDYRR